MRTLIAAISLSTALVGQTENAVKPESSPAWKNALDQSARLMSYAVRNGLAPQPKKPHLVRLDRACAIPLVTITPKIESSMPVVEPRSESRMPMIDMPVCPAAATP